jgi:hypothetical protein
MTGRGVGKIGVSFKGSVSLPVNVFDRSSLQLHGNMDNSDSLVVWLSGGINRLFIRSAQEGLWPEMNAEVAAELR